MSWSCFTGRLWSHADFLKLWTGQSISEFGSQVSQLAIPWLAAVGLHASPIEFSLLGVLGFLPSTWDCMHLECTLRSVRRSTRRRKLSDVVFARV